MDSIRREVLVYADAIAYLENLGLTVKAPFSLVGKSGQPHSFNMVLILPKKGWRGEARTVAIDVNVKGYATEPSVFREYVAKARDMNPSQAYLITTPACRKIPRHCSRMRNYHFSRGGPLERSCKPSAKEAY